jgi:NADPH:quinone reductase-like Zn-dependent oxidoreductase
MLEKIRHFLSALIGFYIMKAIQFYEYGDVETMHLVNIPSPAIGPTEILIRVWASGVNPSDWKRRQAGSEHTLSNF